MVKSGLKRIEAIFYRTAAGGEPFRDRLRALQPIEDRKQIGDEAELKGGSSDGEPDRGHSHRVILR